MGVFGYCEIENPALPPECGPNEDRACKLAKLEGKLATEINMQATIGCEKMSGGIGHGGLKANVKVVLLEGTWVETGAQKGFVLVQPGVLQPFFEVDLPKF